MDNQPYQITTRPFAYTEEDYVEMIRIETAIWPDQYPSVAYFQHEDKSRNPAWYYERVWIEKDGQTVGFAGYMETWWSTAEDEYEFYVNIDPPWQQRGIGSEVYRQIERKLSNEKGAKVLSGRIRGDKESALRFMAKHGYVQWSEYSRSLLDVTTFDETPFVHYEARLREQGIVLKTFSDLSESDPDWATKLWQLNWIIAQDEPGPTQLTRKPLDDFLKATVGGPNFVPDGFIIATDGERYVGLSQLWINDIYPKLLYQGWTGVDRPYRRKGVATGLKVRTIQWAQQVGAERIEADNFKGNPMYDINIRLGFQPAPPFLSYKKKLNE